ncbi:MAG: hypothetical protein U9N87_13875 [Planctomycetota bacterium]|nr:hypothetical protein [Planctomycetota bacterium]
MHKIWPIALGMILLGAIAGCGGSEKTEIPRNAPPLPPGDPGSDTPAAGTEQSTGHHHAMPIN